MREVTERTKLVEQRPTVDVLLLTIPTTGVLAASWLLNVSPFGPLGWAFVGAAGLIWPREQTGTVVSGLAYNGVLIPSIAIAQVAWEVTGSLALGVSLALLTPIWLLKHIHFVLTLSTPETG